MLYLRKGKGKGRRRRGRKISEDEDQTNSEQSEKGTDHNDRCSQHTFMFNNSAATGGSTWQFIYPTSQIANVNIITKTHTLSARLDLSSPHSHKHIYINGGYDCDL